MMIAPAALRRATTTASSLGTYCSNIFEPEVVRIPAVAYVSLIMTGRPWRGPAACFFASISSACFAFASACSSTRVTTTFNIALCFLIRSKTGSVSSRDEISSRRIACTAWAAVPKFGSNFDFRTAVPESLLINGAAVIATELTFKNFLRLMGNLAIACSPFSKDSRHDQCRRQITDSLEQPGSDILILRDFMVEPAIPKTEAAAEKEHLDDNLPHRIKRKDHQKHQPEIAEPFSISSECSGYRIPNHHSNGNYQPGRAECGSSIALPDQLGIVVGCDHPEEMTKGDHRRDSGSPENDGREERSPIPGQSAGNQLAGCKMHRAVDNSRSQIPLSDLFAQRDAGQPAVLLEDQSRKGHCDDPSDSINSHAFNIAPEGMARTAYDRDEDLYHPEHKSAERHSCRLVIAVDQSFSHRLSEHDTINRARDDQEDDDRQNYKTDCRWVHIFTREERLRKRRK